MLTQKSANRKDLLTGKADLQHRHFTTIAAILRDFTRKAGGDGEMTTPREVVLYFADELASTNPKFDRERFLAACQPEA